MEYRMVFTKALFAFVSKTAIVCLASFWDIESKADPRSLVHKPMKSMIVAVCTVCPSASIALLRFSLYVCCQFWQVFSPLDVVMLGSQPSKLGVILDTALPLGAHLLYNLHVPQHSLYVCWVEFNVDAYEHNECIQPL